MATKRNEEVDLLASLVGLLRQKELNVETKQSPTGSYSRVLIDGTSQAWVLPQTRNGIKVTVALSGGRKGFAPERPVRGRFDAHIWASNATTLKQAANAIAAAARESAREGR